MDIKALLSPQQEPVKQQPTQAGSQTPTRKRARTGSLKDYTLVQQAHIVSAQRPGYYPGSSGSPDPSPTYGPHSASAPRNGVPQAYTTQSPRPPAPRSYSDPRGSIPHVQPTSSPRSVSRHGSTSMDTLADLATMQQYARPALNGSRSSDLQSPQRSPSSSNLQFRMDGAFDDGNGPMTPSGSRHGSLTADHPMSDAPTPTLPPASFEVPSLSQDDSQTIARLTLQIGENSFVYDNHVQLVSILRKGLTKHISPTDTPDALQDPSRYPLLQHLRQARDAMLSRFPIGEQLWVEWLEDECVLARTIEDRAGLTELFEKATKEEVGSTRLWRSYGEWTWYLYRMSFDITWSLSSSFVEETSAVGRLLASQQWSDEDKLVGQDLFNWDSVIKVWNEGVTNTQWNVNHSHEVWNARMEILMLDLIRELTKKPPKEKIDLIKRLYTERTRQPHTTWDETFQSFSNFLGQYVHEIEYEAVMEFTTEKASMAKHELALRREREFQLQKASENEDPTAKYQTLIDYVEWETQQGRRKNAPWFSLNLLTALLERANLMFPTDAGLWEDHLDLIMEKKQLRHTLVPVAHRATRHCPWSGELWSRYLYILESNSRPHHEVENIKHHATSTGLLEELGGMDELIKVFTAWCGFLRRQAFRPDAKEDDQDIAHVGIRSALEDVRSIGERKYGKDFKGDPLYRVERIYFKFLSQIGLIEDARKMYDQLTTTHGDQYEFWDRYYLFEMTSWGKQFGRTASKPSDLLRPEHATRVLQRAMKRPNLDWPEKMIEAYIHHCGQHECIERLQEAQVEARRATKLVIKRRAREHAEQAAAQQQYQSQMQQDTVADPSQMDTSDSTASGKRKRGSVDSESSKRPKAASETREEPKFGASSPSVAHEKGRDREHTLVTVSQLPPQCSEEKLRRFFRDCGEIISVVIVPSRDGTSASATVEFASPEDVMTARTKDKKRIDGAVVNVRAGMRSTLWVTNYPAEADEDYIKSLFKSYGEVVEVRLPNLQVKTSRRFCYVQFLNAEQAEAATEMDGMVLEHNLKLVARISDPSIKEDRSGPMDERRELFIGGLHWDTTNEEIQELFQKYGKIERILVPREPKGKTKGIAFIVFSTKEEAEAATEMNLQRFKNRTLKVNLTAEKPAPGNRPYAPTIINKAGSPGAESAGSPMSGVEVGTPENASQNGLPVRSNYRDRSIALIHVPDTVNDARIRKIAEPYGPLMRITLRPDHQGALVEFENVADAGKASLALKGYEIVPGRRVDVGTVDQMWSWGPEKKATGKQPAAAMAPPTGIRRPGHNVARRGGKGGLGFKKGADAGQEKKVDEPMGKTQENKGAKTQDDFRSMLKKNDG